MVKGFKNYLQSEGAKKLQFKSTIAKIVGKHELMFDGEDTSLWYTDDQTVMKAIIKWFHQVPALKDSWLSPTAWGTTDTLNVLEEIIDENIVTHVTYDHLHFEIRQLIKTNQPITMQDLQIWKEQYARAVKMNAEYRFCTAHKSDDPWYKSLYQMILPHKRSIM